MKHLKVNDKAPAFESIDQHGNAFSSATLTGKKFVLYFYPKDLTPGCTAQACNLRDNYTELQAQGFEIIGVSMDDEKLHTRFITKYELPFTLLADTDRKVIETYGVWGYKKFMGKEYDGIHRTTFVVNEAGTIIGIIDKPNTKDHTREILEIYANHK
jgi:peroxiredoxin Q/BCP